MTKRSRHLGSSLDAFLEDEGIYEEAEGQAIKEVIAWQLAEAMKERSLSKARMAALLKTSRSQVDRLLDPERDVTLSTLQRAALVGRKLQVQLVQSAGAALTPPRARLPGAEEVDQAGNQDQPPR
jgi:predicted XRE-type DNA-binding protein